MYKVKQIGIDKVSELTYCMKSFELASSHVKVNIGHSIRFYTNLINNGIGAMFALYKDDMMVGGLGCIKAPDLHEGVLTAIETFWLVLPDHRGKGLLLLNAFEKWADENQCVNKAMIYMSDSFPESLAKLYKKKGYKLAEYHFVKRG